MKVKTKNLSQFLKKINMQGNEEIKEAIFNFTDTGLKISASSNTKTVRVDGLLLKDAFMEYEPIGKIGVQDIHIIKKILDQFEEDIEFLIEANTIKFKDKNKEMITELIDIQFIKEPTELKEMEHNDVFPIDSNIINNVISNASINKEFDIEMKTVEKALTIETTGKYKFKRYFNINEIKGGTEILVGGPFINAVANLTGVVDLYLKTNYPVKIFEKTETTILTYVVAPKVK